VNQKSVFESDAYAPIDLNLKTGLTLAAKREHQRFVAHFAIPVQRTLAGGSAGDEQFTQPGFRRPTDERLVLQRQTLANRSPSRRVKRRSSRAHASGRRPT
jgi:hypothetical protein